MFARELDKSEWPAFFNAFSRRYQGRAMTLDLPEPHTLGTIEVIARDLPLVGITAERAGGDEEVASIEILLGISSESHLTHTINHPTHVAIDQVNNGTDDVIVIHSLRDPTVRLNAGERIAVEPVAARPQAVSNGE
jgi:hypothetical protein